MESHQAGFPLPQLITSPSPTPLEAPHSEKEAKSVQTVPCLPVFVGHESVSMATTGGATFAAYVTRKSTKYEVVQLEEIFSIDDP